MQQYLEYSNVVSPHSHFWGYSKHLSPQMDPKKQQTLSTNLENFWNSDYAFIPFVSHSVAKPCSSSSWDEPIPIKFKIARVVKTNFRHGTILSNIIFKITLQRCKTCLQDLVQVLTLSYSPTFHYWVKFWNLGCYVAINKMLEHFQSCT